MWRTRRPTSRIPPRNWLRLARSRSVRATMTRPLSDTAVEQRRLVRSIAGWFEDFDHPPAPVADLPMPQPPSGPTEAEIARQEGWNDSFLAACRGGDHQAARAETLGVAVLLTKLDAMDQQLEAAVQSNATVLAQWLVEALTTIVPGLLRDEAEPRTLQVAAVLRRALRSVTKLEVCGNSGPATPCATADDAWREIIRRRNENPHEAAVSLHWPNGRASFDEARAWAEIRAAMLPMCAQTSVVPPSVEVVRHG